MKPETDANGDIGVDIPEVSAERQRAEQSFGIRKRRILIREHQGKINPKRMPCWLSPITYSIIGASLIKADGKQVVGLPKHKGRLKKARVVRDNFDDVCYRQRLGVGDGNQVGNVRPIDADVCQFRPVGNILIIRHLDITGQRAIVGLINHIRYIRHERNTRGKCPVTEKADQTASNVSKQ